MEMFKDDMIFGSPSVLWDGIDKLILEEIQI